MSKICCFAGHRQCNITKELQQQIYCKCIELILYHDVKEFWTGHYGEFDQLAAGIIRKIKQKDLGIQLNLILPYLTAEINQQKNLYAEKYDHILMAEIPLNTPKQYWILKCNQYMIDHASFLIAYINFPFGGAAQSLSYANQKKDITIFQFGSTRA